MENDRDIKFDIVIDHHSALSKFSRCLPFSKWLPKHGIKMGGVKIQHCPISSKFDMWVDNDVPTLKNSTGRHFQNGRHNTAQIQHCPISTKFHM
jgi:hypothetical protein